MNLNKYINNMLLENTIKDKKLKEDLSDYAHEAWSGWMKYMFKQGKFNDDGTWVMPKESVDRWKRQMETSYKKLPKGEEKSDIEQADKILTIIAKHK